MKEVLPDKINITCTDNDQVKEAYLSRFIDGDHMEVIVNTVKIHLKHNGRGLYVGNMAGFEFTAKSPEITQIKHFRR